MNGVGRWLAFALILRWILHAFYLPAFEGPDEPFHLARARLVADALVGSTDLGSALRGRRMDAELLEAVQRAPCGDDLERVFSCPPMASADAEFNVLRQRGDRRHEDAATVRRISVENYQAHQPPLYYLIAGASLLPLQGAGVRSHLLALRLLAVLFSALGIRLLLPVIKERWRLVFLAGLWLPGAAESLIRVANDAPVFLWAALLLRRHLSDRRQSLAGTASLLALGPLLKLTALPVAAFVVVDALRRRGLGAALGLGAASGLFLPLQWLRGWAWGGTLELDAGLASGHAVGTILFGLAHSAYTFVKTAIWLGGWSVFRPPDMLLVAGAMLLLAWLPIMRLREDRRRLLPHVAALAVALAGFVVFAIGKRELFGVWGAVGGWYAWAWWPWCVVLLQDLVTDRDRSRATAALAAVSVAWIVAVQVAWWIVAHGLYGA